MKHFFSIVLLMFFLHSLSSADGFNSVHTSNGLDIWAVGLNGNVFRSVDGGATWSSLTQGTATLRSVYALASSVWMVADDGKCFSSTDDGSTWIQESPAGTTPLTKILFLNAQTGWIAGANGTLLRTTNGGTSWNAGATGTSQKISALFFVDAQVGYIGGTNGLLMKTNNGGATWTSIAGAGWTKDVTSIAASGSTLYVTGVDAFCVKSINGGASWNALNFNTDTQSDVNGVFAKSANEAVFVGGGGYVRVTSSGGSGFTYGRHPFHGALSSVYFFDGLKGWACSEKFNVVLRTTDGGLNWSMPTGTTTNLGWVQKLNVSATVRGNAFSINPLNKNILYCALGTKVYASYNRGENWSIIATMPSGGTKVNSFYVSPKDSNLWVAAYGSPDRIVRSTNRGSSWTVTITRDFSEYGMPLEMDGSHPDTLYFGPEDGYLYRSTNFGTSWDTLSRPQFRSPCDVVVARDNPDVIWVGDGVTGSGQGQLFRSRNGGRTFSLIYTTTGSEIPTTVGSSLDTRLGYATAWGSGGVMKTVDMAETWSSVATTSSTWGIDIAKDDPNVMMYGVYGGGTSYVSSNAASSFTTSALTGSNYAIYAYDRGTFFAQQSGGIWRYNISYIVPTSNAQAIALIAPNGGENWTFGATRNITWTASNVANVKIEFKTSPTSAWQTIVTSMPAGAGVYAWQIPNAPSSQARVRISDVSDNNPIDSSDANFSITVASIAAQPTSLNFTSVTVGSSRTEVITLTNGGTAPLVLSGVTTTNPAFVVGRTSFTIPAGQSDTLSVMFTPNVPQSYSEQLNIVCNAPGSPFTIPMTGIGASSGTLAVLSPNGGEVWQANSTHDITWAATNLDRIEISYKLSPTDSWRRVVQTMPASQGTYSWVIPNTPTTHARIRISDRQTGTVIDSSDGEFTITGPTSVSDLSGTPTTYELHQNYPNPFNPSTVITYGVPKDGFVTLKVFNMIGQEVATLVSEQLPAGRYSATFDTQKLSGNASSGLYFYRLTAGEFSEIRKMMLLK